MKRLISIIIVILFLTGCSVIEEEKPVPVTSDICAVWLYFSELSMIDETGGTEKSFRKKIEKITENCVEKGINTIFIQVRPYCDAFYKSKIFPWTSYLTGKQGGAVDYDPLKIAVETAHKSGISIHAWINPFRISTKTNSDSLSKDNPAMKWINVKAPDVVKVNGGYYFSPASLEAQRLIIDGVREIVENYDVDGIHIDDYFYPSAEDFVDRAFYDKYKKSGGELSLRNWRLNTISAFVSQLYAATKSVSGDCVFSISPAGNIRNNYNEQFADVKLWLSRRGYADWIIPQLYYGFENEILPFDNACDAWSSMERCDDVKLIYGIGAYRVNNSDEEWRAGSGIINKQIDYAKGKSDCYGVAFFSYSSITDKKAESEFSELGEKVLSQPLSQGESQ